MPLAVVCPKLGTTRQAFLAYRGTTPVARAAVVDKLAFDKPRCEPLVDGCDGPTRPVLLRPRVSFDTRGLFFRRLPGDGRIGACAS
nr:hypothetical protein [Kibdelosporangium sp. MJ126-NF4]CTQ91866.1 hypothetical protein [Kibdelosporangium sp. MJ126-NF4]